MDTQTIDLTYSLPFHCVSMPFNPRTFHILTVNEMDKTNPKIAFQRVLPSDINEGEHRSGEMDVAEPHTASV